MLGRVWRHTPLSLWSEWIKDNLVTYLLRCLNGVFRSFQQETQSMSSSSNRRCLSWQFRWTICSCHQQRNLHLQYVTSLLSLSWNFLFCESNSGVIHLAIGSCRIHGWFDSALHPSRVAKSTSFGWYKVGKVTAVGWQVTLCDPIWHVISRSGVVILITNCVYFTYFFRSSFRSRWL